MNKVELIDLVVKELREFKKDNIEYLRSTSNGILAYAQEKEENAEFIGSLNNDEHINYRGSLGDVIDAVEKYMSTENGISFRDIILAKYIALMSIRATLKI